MATVPITVVKCGGGTGIDRDALCGDLADVPGPVVLVHGGAADLDELAGRLGVAQRRLTRPDGVASRYTDAATLEVVLLALAGKVKPRLLGGLARAGVRAVGLTGLDDGLLVARRVAAHRAVVGGRRVAVHDDHSGPIVRVDAAVPRLLLDAGITPVISPPALGEDGRPVNVDADRAAAAVAVELGAQRLLFLTAAPGLLADPADERSALGSHPVPHSGPVTGGAVGGMRVKLLAARAALAGGVPWVTIADGRVPRPVTAALAGAGTRIRLATVNR